MVFCYHGLIFMYSINMINKINSILSTKLIKNVSELLCFSQHVANDNKNYNKNYLLVVMFSTSTCPPCNATKEMFNSQYDMNNTNLQSAIENAEKDIELRTGKNDWNILVYTCTINEQEEELERLSKTSDGKIFIDSPLTESIIKSIINIKVKVVPTFHAIYLNKNNVTDLELQKTGAMRSIDQLRDFFDHLIELYCQK